jgi:hypothetical protein
MLRADCCASHGTLPPPADATCAKRLRRAPHALIWRPRRRSRGVLFRVPNVLTPIPLRLGAWLAIFAARPEHLGCASRLWCRWLLCRPTRRWSNRLGRPADPLPANVTTPGERRYWCLAPVFADAGAPAAASPPHEPHASHPSGRGDGHVPHASRVAKRCGLRLSQPCTPPRS